MDYVGLAFGKHTLYVAHSHDIRL